MKRRKFLEATLPTGVAIMGTATAIAATGKQETPGLVNPVDFGAKGDDKTDCTEAFQKALDAMTDGSTLMIPVGNFLVRKTLYVRKKQHVLITGQGPGSRLIAGAAMKSLLYAEHPFSGSSIESLSLDANSKADVALRIEGGGYVRVNNINIWSPREIGIHGGLADKKTGPEFIVTNSRLTGMKQPTPDDPASKLGILVEKNWTDSHYDNLIIRGFVECAMELRANSNLINKVHVYRYPAYQYFSGMRLKGNENYLVQAYFDNAIDVGCEILGNNTTILSSYILRIKLAFNKGPVAPGIGIQIGNKDKKVKNVNIINTSFVNHVPDTPEYAANKLTGIKLVNGEHIVAYDNQYDRTEFGDTRMSGKTLVEPGRRSNTVTLNTLVDPGNIQLTPTSKIIGSYWIGNADKHSFAIHLSEANKEAVSFDFLVRE